MPNPNQILSTEQQAFNDCVVAIVNKQHVLRGAWFPPMNSPIKAVAIIALDANGDIYTAAATDCEVDSEVRQWINTLAIYMEGHAATLSDMVKSPDNYAVQPTTGDAL